MTPFLASWASLGNKILQKNVRKLLIKSTFLYPIFSGFGHGGLKGQAKIISTFTLSKNGVCALAGNNTSDNLGKYHRKAF